jgi:FkbM family methyltransferase
MIKAAIRRAILSQPNLTRFIVDNVIAGTHAPAVLLRRFGVDLVFDVGANVGQFAQELRAVGYTGRIVSFEPLSSAFEALRDRARRDSLWTINQFGLGDCDGEAVINVSKGSSYSSILNALPSLSRFDSTGTSLVARESVSIRTFDSVFSEFRGNAKQPFLKIDVQGYERKVLDGAKSSLPELTGIQLELSFVELYDGETLIEEMVSRLAHDGFRLVCLQPLYTNLSAGALLQADGYFFRI